MFFPSYKYEAWVWQQLQGTNFGRPIFREPQDSASVDSVLDSYASAIRKPNSIGAMLFSVVGKSYLTQLFAFIINNNSIF